MTNNRAVKFASDVIDAKRKINGIISHCSMFKIGKTGKLLSQRFDEPDYNGVYEKIDYVYRSIFAQDGCPDGYRDTKALRYKVWCA